jgi:probable rRNA maturation factor
MIHIQPPPEFSGSAALERAAHQALKLADAWQPGEADLTIVLTGDEKLRQLNREYLGLDEVTDVLSFPAAEQDPETGTSYLGDILISMPRAKLQAERAGHTLDEELQLLVVHGVLHLLGYDHANPRQKSGMWKAQGRVLEDLGLSGIKIPE